MTKIDRHQQYIDEHDRLATLFVMDRFAFEVERKRILNEAIKSLSNSEKRRAEQKELDRILKGTGSAENRLAIIQAFFWHHLINNWQPNLQVCATTLNTLIKGTDNRSVLTLLK